MKPAKLPNSHTRPAPYNSGLDRGKPSLNSVGGMPLLRWTAAQDGSTWPGHSSMPRSTLTTLKLHGTTQTKAAKNETQNTKPSENHFSSAFCAVVIAVMASLRNALGGAHQDAIAATVYVGLAPAGTEPVAICRGSSSNFQSGPHSPMAEAIGLNPMRVRVRVPRWARADSPTGRGGGFKIRSVHVRPLLSAPAFAASRLRLASQPRNGEGCRPSKRTERSVQNAPIA